MELRLDGKRVFAATGGRSFDTGLPSVVLLHGAGLDHSIWAMQARALAHHGRNVLAFDLPGHGRSDGPACDSIGAMAAWVVEALDACGVRRFRVAGHSMGALLAFDIAARVPERVEAAALLGFTPEMRVHPALLAAARAGDALAIGLIVSWGMGPAGQLGGNPVPGLWLSGSAIRLLERGDRATLAADLAACDAYRADQTAAICCPLLFLFGGEDRMTPPSPARAFAAGFAGAQTVQLPGVGHMMTVEAPVPVLAALMKVV